MNTLTTYIAKSTMELKDVNTCLSFISTVWREKPLVLVYDNLNQRIVTSWFDPEYQVGDLDLLENLIKEFLQVNY